MPEKPSIHNPDSQRSCDSSAPENPPMQYDDLLFDVGNENHVEFLQKCGENHLLDGKTKGVALFDMACSIEPKNASLLYRQGIALFEYGCEGHVKKYLLLANKKFRQATKLSPDLVLAWQAWGDTLLFLGQITQEHHYFLNARSKYEAALDRITEENGVDDLSGLHWSYANSLCAIAKHSTEAYDLNQALNAFAKADSINDTLPETFWLEYGHTALDFGLAITDSRFIIRAIDCYKTALEKSRSSELGWVALAKALSHLYEVTHDEDHFCQANECFINAAKIAPTDYKIWLPWASLLLHSGKQLKDAKRLHSCIEKCHRAYSCNPKKANILLVWADALSALGVIASQLDYVYEGKNKVAQAVDLVGNTVDTSRAEGNVLFALGQYHEAVDYYYQAIEKYQEGLSIDRTKDDLWYKLGHSYRLCAELDQDFSLYERAIRFYLRAIDLKNHSLYYYEYAYTLYLQGEYMRDTATLELSILHFEQAFSLQKNAVYLHPQWLFDYAKTLDLLGDLTFQEAHYVKAIDMLKRVIVLEPEFRDIHYHIALTYAHLAELSSSTDMYHRALSHFKMAYQKNEEHERLMLDWGLCFLNLAEITPVYEDARETYFNEAEHKIILAAKWGHSMAYYYLACLYSLKKEFEQAMKFLKKAQDYDALPIVEDLIDDEWLDNLRSTDSFQAFIQQVDQQANKENFS